MREWAEKEKRERAKAPHERKGKWEKIKYSPAIGATSFRTFYLSQLDLFMRVAQSWGARDGEWSGMAAGKGVSLFYHLATPPRPFAVRTPHFIVYLIPCCLSPSRFRTSCRFKQIFQQQKAVVRANEMARQGAKVKGKWENKEVIKSCRRWHYCSLNSLLNFLLKLYFRYVAKFGFIDRNKLNAD